VNAIACTGSIAAAGPVAIVRQRTADAGSDEVVLYDYSSGGNPRIACSFGGHVIVQLIDPRHIVIVQQSAAVVELPEVRFHWFESGRVAPTLDEVAWSHPDVSSRTVEVHVTTSADDHVVTSVPNDLLDRCGPGSKLDFSRSGAHFFLLDRSAAELISLTVVAGVTTVLSVVPPGGGWAKDGEPGVAVWSPTSETLFYRQAGDVWEWTPDGGSQRFLPGVSWVSATVSADGTHLAYSVARPDGLHDVYLVTLNSDADPKLITSSGRSGPAFLTATQLWYRVDGESSGGCGGTSGELALIYDVSNGSETPSSIDEVIAAWPATSSDFP
jgi:hypothetical protein